MGAVLEGPRRVHEIENVWIPMSDGTRIAARMWLPEDSNQRPVPALVEYIPYRKRDLTRLGDDQIHPVLASYGYACVRPDIRGSGDSGGLPQDEYVQQEQDDAVEIIAWLADQPWCTGNVGMFGISWGGFSCLQVAARRPPALKAIITHCSTDDRYADDAHYSGGCINEGMFLWGSSWMTTGLLPPDPAIAGDGWREQWLERLHSRGFYVSDWLAHQHRDAFWKHGSIAEDYASITCAVYAVGGWADPYRATVPRMLAKLSCPRKGLVGPWGHQYPQRGEPGPAIDWLTEALRWWEHWLKGADTGIMDEPMYRVWMQQVPATRGTQSVPGRWVAEDRWPSSEIAQVTSYLTGTGLEPGPAADEPRTLTALQTAGSVGGPWLAAGPAELPGDQRIDDVRSLSFDSAPLAENLEILGAPAVHLDLAVDRRVAFVIVRLNEVGPDGTSTRVSYGVLNLTHRNGDESPEPLEPGRRYPVRVQLHDCAQAFRAGNRIRLAVSTTYWPLIWPSPEPVTLTVYIGQSQLELPVRRPRAADAQLRPFGTAPEPATVGRAAKPGRNVFEWDVVSQKLTHRYGDGWEVTIPATGTELLSSVDEVSEISDADPTSATIERTSMMRIKRARWDTRAESTIRLSVSRDEFLLSGEVRAFEGEKEIFSRTWKHNTPRLLI